MFPGKLPAGVLAQVLGQYGRPGGGKRPPAFADQEVLVVARHQLQCAEKEKTVDPGVHCRSRQVVGPAGQVIDLFPIVRARRRLSHVDDGLHPPHQVIGGRVVIQLASSEGETAWDSRQTGEPDIAVAAEVIGNDLGQLRLTAGDQDPALVLGGSLSFPVETATACQKDSSSL